MVRKLRLANPRKAWVKARAHTGAMKGTRLAIPVGVEARYRKKLVDLSDQMTRETRKAVIDLFKHEDFKSYFDKLKQPVTVAMDVSPASQARILTNALKDKFEQLFTAAAKPSAETMADQANNASQSSVNESLKKLSGGMAMKTDFLTGPMKEFLTGTVAENVSLIKSIPSEYFSKVQGAVLRSITQGKGVADLQDFFSQQEGITSRRAKNIALDQTRKTYNGLNKLRMTAVGIPSFEWVHSGGGLHPRPLHQSYNGRIFRFDNLPVIDENTGERGIPGQAINCGCTMVPVMQFEGGKAA